MENEPALVMLILLLFYENIMIFISHLYIQKSQTVTHFAFKKLNQFKYK